MLNSETKRKLYDEIVMPVHGEDVLYQWLQNFHGEHDPEHLLKFQLCENLDNQLVEYAGKLWVQRNILGE